MLNIIIASIIAYGGGGFGGFGIYVNQGNLDNLNKILQSHGIQTLSNTQYGWGGLGYGIVGKVWIGGGGYGTEQKVSSDSMELSLKIGSGFFEIGYSLYQSHRVIGALTLALGGSGYSMAIYPNNNDQTFDSLLNNPRRDAYVIISSSLSITPYANLLIRLNRFIGLFFKAGYTISTGTDWRFDDGDKVLNPPDISPSGFVGSLNVVFGGFSERSGE